MVLSFLSTKGVIIGLLVLFAVIVVYLATYSDSLVRADGNKINLKLSLITINIGNTKQSKKKRKSKK